MQFIPNKSTTNPGGGFFYCHTSDNLYLRKITLFRGKNNRKKMTKVITGEEAVQILAHSFIVSQSASGYTLNYSGDGINWTAYSDSTPANEDCIVVNCAWGTFIKLVGNTGQVTINF